MPNPPPEPLDPKALTVCAFCAKTQREVASLIAGPKIHEGGCIAICDECISLCNEILTAKGSLSLPQVQGQVRASWTLESYSAEFLASGPPARRDITHALLHVTKAMGRIAGLVDELDHGRKVGWHELMPFVADLVICAARITNVIPDAVDLGRAVAGRLDAKRREHVRHG